MKKRIVPMLMIVLLVTISLAASVDFENAYGQGQKDEVIYNTIQFDYCVVTGLTDQEADNVFAKLDEYDQSTTELVEDTFPDCNSTNDLEGTILYLQSNYESVKNAMTGHEEELDAYLLFNSIEYYKDNYDCIEQRVEDAQTATASNGSSVVSQSFTNLYVKSISLTSEKCFIEIDTWDSGIYFLGYDYFIEDKVLQITVYSEGLCLRRGKPWPVKINIFDDALAEVNRICFKDGQTIKQIYPS